MKALPKRLLPLTLFGIAVTSLFFVRPVQGFTITMEQMGSNFVANGSGAFNLTGLTFSGSAGADSVGINANLGIVLIGTLTAFLTEDQYGGFTGPTSFGSGSAQFPDTISGDFVAISGLLSVPQGYVSGSALSNSMTFNSATFASLGLTPGTYVWTWGTGLPNQNFTLVIGRGTVPDAGSTVSLLGFALLGLAALRRKLGC